MPVQNAGATRKPALINATLECIAQSGIDALTLDQVAERAGCSKGVAAYHFKTKQALVIASLKAFLTSYQARLELGGNESAQATLDLLIDTVLPACEATGTISDGCASIPKDLPINVFPDPDARAITLSPDKETRLSLAFFAKACQDSEIAAILHAQNRSDAAAIAPILEAAALERGARLADPAEDAYHFLALAYGLAFFRSGNFFPPGHHDNCHILSRNFGGSP